MSYDIIINIIREGEKENERNSFYGAGIQVHDLGWG